MSVPVAGQKRLVIVGATGMVGGYALRYALDRPDVGCVTAIGRRKISLSHPNLTQVQHPDFADCLSGNGADRTERSRIAFARYKGEAENALIAAGFPRVYIFRPGYIYPVEPRKEPNLSYRMLRAIYPVFRLVFPNQVIPADDLARAMVDVAVRETPETGGPVFENRDIRAMATIARYRAAT